MSVNNGVKVTVVVPVYNPGPRIEGLIHSLAGQTLPLHEYEVVFVDDGSTDETPARLEQVCSEHANMRVTTIPNSGWPGRPRAVGTDLAKGEYVFYADNDDELFPESLERLHDMAATNGSDIVYGKIVRTGRTTPYWDLWRRNVPVADPVGDRVCLSRTVHKLFRRQFLLDHQIRFPEGKVRLEDFAFMGQAIPRAKVISILADYPVYRWKHESGGPNHSNTEVEAGTYWGYFKQALQIMVDNAGEGELVDDARLTATMQAFSRFQPESYLARPAPKQQAVFRAVSDMLMEQVPRRLDARLPVFKRVRVHALREEDKDRFDGLQRLRTEMVFQLSTEQVAWKQGVLHLSVRASLRGPDTLTVLEQPAAGGDRLQLRSHPDLWPDDDEVRALHQEDRGELELTVRHRGTGIEWPVHGTTTLELQPSSEGVRLGVRVEGVLDPQKGYFGSPLEDGTWDVIARVQFLGERAVLGVPAPRWVSGPRPAGNRTARLKTSSKGRLQLALGYEAGAAKLATPVVVGTAWSGDCLRLTLANAPDFGSTVITRHVTGGDGVEVPVTRGVAMLPLDHVREGQVVDAYLRLRSPGAVRDQRLAIGTTMTVDARPPFAVQVDAAHGLSVRRLRPQESPPAPVSVELRHRRRTLPTRGHVFAALPGPVQRLVRKVWRLRGRR